MRSIGKRLLALEGGPRGQFDDVSDGELSERLNKIYSQLRPFGYDYANIDPSNPDALEWQMMILAPCGGCTGRMLRRAALFKTIGTNDTNGTQLCAVPYLGSVKW